LLVEKDALAALEDGKEREPSCAETARDFHALKTKENVKEEDQKRMKSYFHYALNAKAVRTTK